MVTTILANVKAAGYDLSQAQLVNRLGVTESVQQETMVLPESGENISALSVGTAAASASGDAEQLPSIDAEWQVEHQHALGLGYWVSFC